MVARVERRQRRFNSGYTLIVRAAGPALQPLTQCQQPQSVKTCWCGRPRGAQRCGVKLERAYIISAMEELVNIALDEVALEGPAGTNAQMSCEPPATERGALPAATGSGAGCGLEQLWTLLQECLPVAGLTVLTEAVKRSVWDALLLHTPDDVARVFAEGRCAPAQTSCGLLCHSNVSCCRSS